MNGLLYEHAYHTTRVDPPPLPQGMPYMIGHPTTSFGHLIQEKNATTSYSNLKVGDVRDWQRLSARQPCGTRRQVMEECIHPQCVDKVGFLLDPGTPSHCFEHLSYLLLLSTSLHAQHDACKIATSLRNSDLKQLDHQGLLHFVTLVNVIPNLTHCRGPCGTEGGEVRPRVHARV